MDNQLAGKVAIVTGGASGIALSVVRHLCAAGTKVMAGDLNIDQLTKLAAELGENFAWLKTDVTREDEGAALMSQALDQFGALNMAFNVARASKPGYIVDLQEADWDFTIDLCLKGVFLGMKHQAKQMIQQGSGGSSVNVASFAAHMPSHAGSGYAAAKAGVEMLTKNGALEFAQFGICVNAVLPGLTQTPMAKRHLDNPEALAAFVDRIPLGRPAHPDEIARPAILLAGDSASYVSGASLLVDGGWKVAGYQDMRPFRGPSKWQPVL